MVMPTARVNNTNIYYETRGQGNSLVLLHGFALDTRLWDEQYNAFSKDFKVIRYDMRGFGRSDPPRSQPYSHSDDLVALLNYLSVDSAIVVGLSRGGRCSIQFALDNKERASGLVLVSSRPTGFMMEKGRPSSASDIVDKARSSGVPAAREAWLNHPIYRFTRKQHEVFSRVKMMVSDYSGWHWLNEDPLIRHSTPAVQRLDEISVPTLVVVGNEDISDFKRAAHLLQQQISGARRKVMNGVGHLPNLENPDEFNASVLSFLKDLP